MECKGSGSDGIWICYGRSRSEYPATPRCAGVPCSHWDARRSDCSCEREYVVGSCACDGVGPKGISAGYSSSSAHGGSCCYVARYKEYHYSELCVDDPECM